MNLKWITIIKVEEYLYTGLKFNFSRFLLWLVMFNEKHVGHYIWYFKIVCIFLKFELWGSRMTLKWITIINVEEYLKAGLKFNDFLNLKKNMSALHYYKISPIGPLVIRTNIFSNFPFSRERIPYSLSLLVYPSYLILYQQCLSAYPLSLIIFLLSMIPHLLTIIHHLLSINFYP